MALGGVSELQMRCWWGFTHYGFDWYFGDGAARVAGL